MQKLWWVGAAVGVVLIVWSIWYSVSSRAQPPPVQAQPGVQIPLPSKRPGVTVEGGTGPSSAPTAPMPNQRRRPLESER